MQPIVPDVFVRQGADGGWLVELNHDTLPKVLVNQTYYSKVSKTAKKDSDKSYLAECLQTATWLVRALDQRAKTILKVASEIVRQQDASSSTAYNTCARSISRPSPTRSRCTS